MLPAAKRPFESKSWCASLAVVLARGGDLVETTRMGFTRVAAAVRRVMSGWDTTRPCWRVIRAVFAALPTPSGRRTSLRWIRARRAGDDRLGPRPHAAADVEARKIGVLDQLQLTELVTTIRGLSAVSAAAMLAQT